MTKLLSVAAVVFTSVMAHASDRVFIYEPAVTKELGGERGLTSEPAKLASIDLGLYEKTMKEAIKTFEDAMRGTCAHDTEVSISVTAEGGWIIIGGVQVSSGVKLHIRNPQLAKGCACN